MPLNATERTQIVQAFLQTFGENYYWCARTLKMISILSSGQINLLAAVQAEALTWPPFIASGLSIAWWNTELARIFNSNLALDP